jgi:hypothetical protein
MSLVISDDGAGGVARCASCHAVAAGPCARCALPMCGDCVVLTEGGAGVWAICHDCDRRGGRSLRRGWIAALFWLVLPVVMLWGLIQIVERLF